MPAKRSKERPYEGGSPEQPHTGIPPGGELFRQRVLAPDPAAAIPAIFLRSPTWHPFLFRKRIDRADDARPGDLVAVYGPNDRVLGYALYNPRSEIAARMVFYGEELPDDAAWQKKLDDAVELRHGLLHLPDATDAYRVVHAEADGLPGLVVDRLGDVLSAEAYTLGMYQRAEAILARLAPALGTKAAVVRPSPQFLSQEGYEPPGLASAETAEKGDSPHLPTGGCSQMGTLPFFREVTIREYGTRFRVRFEGGHKTGFFCDQRENRRRLADFCQGRTVLDLCCYTGGFAVQAKCLGKAAEVTGVDLDEEPLKLARENANLNQARIRFVQDDAFAYMREMLRLERRYDVVVLDPPKLIRSRAELEEGTRKHLDLNRLAMRLVKTGGLMLSCCCSGLLKEPDFVQLLRQSAYQAGELISAATEEAPERHAARPMQILARTGAAADHPVSAVVPETEYLKAVWMRLG